MSNDTNAKAPDSESEWLVGLDLAALMLGGVSRQTLYRLAADGQLRMVKIRRRILIPRGDVEALIARSEL